MGNPMINISDNFSVRAAKITALKVSDSAVYVHFENGIPACIDARDHQEARHIRNYILTEIRAASVSGGGIRSKSSMHALAAEDVSNDPVSARIFSRQDRVNQIVDVFKREFGESTELVGFMHDLWIALQVIYGPSGAATFISECQGNQG